MARDCRQQTNTLIAVSEAELIRHKPLVTQLLNHSAVGRKGTWSHKARLQGKSLSRDGCGTSLGLFSGLQSGKNYFIQRGFMAALL